MMVEHQRIKDEYGAISDSLFVKDSIIEANAIEIKKLLNTEWEYYKIKKKLLRFIKKLWQNLMNIQIKMIIKF